MDGWQVRIGRFLGGSPGPEVSPVIQPPITTLGFKVMKSLGRAQAFLPFIISLLLILYPSYSQYNQLVEVDIFPSILFFENLDQEDLLIDNKSKTTIGGLSNAILIFSPGANIFNPLPSLAFPIFFPHPISCVLRC